MQAQLIIIQALMLAVFPILSPSPHQPAAIIIVHQIQRIVAVLQNQSHSTVVPTGFMSIIILKLHSPAMLPATANPPHPLVSISPIRWLSTLRWHALIQLFPYPFQLIRF